jgi:hypothetical protein
MATPFKKIRASTCSGTRCAGVSNNYVAVLAWKFKNHPKYRLNPADFTPMPGLPLPTTHDQRKSTAAWHRHPQLPWK